MTRRSGRREPKPEMAPEGWRYVAITDVEYDAQQRGERIPKYLRADDPTAAVRIICKQCRNAMATVFTGDLDEPYTLHVDATDATFDMATDKVRVFCPSCRRQPNVPLRDVRAAMPDPRDHLGRVADIPR